ncbi:MAG: GNAT family N-acetyltransferase [Desulfobacteraceae bacterium]|nr:MAG: GNAT family N-acetyltransferase [Desulfobacteraceae bacterium]
MKLVPINRNEFSIWMQFRSKIYPLISHEYDLKEIENIFVSELWHCWFIEREDNIRIGLVELSLRNIVDGCLGSPIPYLEGLYLDEEERSKGRGSEVIEMIKRWCQSNGYSELATDVELTNIRAQKFYEKLGFEQVDRVVEYRLELKKTSQG